jgi:putative two-component system response regulator
MDARDVKHLSDTTLDLSTRAQANAARVLVAGDREGAAFMSEVLRNDGYAVARVPDGWAALDHLRQCSPDVALLDQSLRGLDGVDVCRLAKADLVTRLVPVMIVSDREAREQRLKGIEAGADELISEPIDACELTARVRSLVRMKRVTNDLDLAASVMMTLATMIEARNRYSKGHCHRMASYSAALGRRIGLSTEDLEALRRGGFLHDIGMLAIPEAVLGRPDTLAPHEYALVQSHTTVGESLISNMRSLQPVRSIVRHHHERLDGSGYPDGIQGDEISVPAQIVGLVDTYEALTTRRPYQHTRSSGEAIELLRDQVARGWRRRDLVEPFAELVVQIKAAIREEDL